MMAGQFERYRDNSDENNLKLRYIYDTHARAAGAIMQASKICAVPNLSHWMHGHPSYLKLPDQQYYALAFFAAVRGWLEIDQDFLYRALCKRLGQNTGTLPNAKLERHYEVYRLSFIARGYILKGSLDLYRTAGDVTIRTKEFTRVQPDVAKGGEITWPRSGFLVPRGGNQFLLMATKDEYPEQVQTAYLQDFGSMNHLEGPFTDWHGPAFYSGHIIAYSRDDALPPSKAAALRPDQVDDAIVKKLQELSRTGNILTLQEYGGRNGGQSRTRQKRRPVTSKRKRSSK